MTRHTHVAGDAEAMLALERQRFPALLFLVVLVLKLGVQPDLASWF